MIQSHRHRHRHRHRPTSLHSSFTNHQSTPSLPIGPISHKESTNASEVTPRSEGECTTSATNLAGPISSRELSIPDTLPWYPRHLQGRIPLPERRKGEYTIRYPDHAVLDPKVQKDATSTDAYVISVHVPVDGGCAPLQQSAGSNPLGQPRPEIPDLSELQNGKYAISRPCHGRLNPYHGVPDSTRQGKTTAVAVAPVVILGLTVGFFVGVILMKKRG